jgi:hypothetical protein
MHSETVLRTNLVSWLKDQAALSFVFDRCTGRHHVKDSVVASYHPVFPLWSQSAQHTMRAASAKPSDDLLNLHTCLMFQKWNMLLSGGRYDVIEHIDDTLRSWGYDDFQFLDHGARAFAFRTIHRPTGERRVLRVEAPHSFRQDRYAHPTVAIAHHIMQGVELDNIKIEVCDEFVPLNKIPDAKKFHSPSSPFHKYYGDLVDLAGGTNMTYPEIRFDKDADPQNVGLSPSGHILTFDPQIIKGDEAINCYRNFEDPTILRHASTEQLRLVYGRPHLSAPQRSPP